MDRGTLFIDLVEANDIVVQAMWSEKTNKVLQKQSEDFQRGALWGMSWAMNNIWAYTTKLHMPEQLQKNCGESSIDHASLSASDRLAAMHGNTTPGRII